MKPPILVFVSFGLSSCDLRPPTQVTTTRTAPPSAQRSAFRHRHRGRDAPGDSCGPTCNRRSSSYPPRRKIATVFGGDTVDWVFDGGHVASRFISVKPKLANTTTDIHIVSDHGNEYTSAAPGDFERRRRALRFQGLHRPRRQGREGSGLPICPSSSPAAELDKAKQEAVAAKAAQAAELKSEEVKAETYRSQYPGSLHFDFTWDEKKGKELGLQQIWHDDKFTYLRGQYSRRRLLSTS